MEDILHLQYDHKAGTCMFARDALKLDFLERANIKTGIFFQTVDADKCCMELSLGGKLTKLVFNKQEYRVNGSYYYATTFENGDSLRFQVDSIGVWKFQGRNVFRVTEYNCFTREGTSQSTFKFFLKHNLIFISSISEERKEVSWDE